MNINCQPVHLQANELIMINTWLLVEISKVSNDFSGYFLALDEKTCSDIIESDDAVRPLSMFCRTNQQPVFSYTGHGGSLVERLMEHLALITEIAENHPYADRIMLLMVHTLMLQSVTMLPQGNTYTLTPQEETFQRFINLLANNYSRHHDSKFYADSLHITSSYLARVLRNIAGRSVKGFIADMLQQDATERLRKTTLPVAQISDDLGFSDATTFSKCFKQRMGMSPIEYRKKYRKDIQ